MNKLLKVISTMKTYGEVEFKIIEFEIKSVGKTIVVFEDEYKNSTRLIKELGVVDTIWNDWYMFESGNISFATWCLPDNLDEAKNKLTKVCGDKVKEILDTCNKFKSKYGAIM